MHRYLEIDDCTPLMSSHVYHFHILNFGERSFLSTLLFRSVCSTTLLPCHDCLCSDHIDFLFYHLVCSLACISNPPFELTGTDIDTGTFLLFFVLSWIINTNMGPFEMQPSSHLPFVLEQNYVIFIIKGGELFQTDILFGRISSFNSFIGHGC